MKDRVRLFRLVLASLLLASLLVTGLPNPALALPNSTVGVLSLVPAFEQISVYSNFSNDDNANARAYVEYRQVGTTQWKRGVDLTPDRRDQLAEFDEAIGGSKWIPNPYKGQFRGIIFGLQTRTQYEVRVTYVDPDGVTGSPVTATVTTRDDNPPSSGPTKPATPSTLATVLAGAQPGDIISLAPGTYTGGIDITVNGQPNNYITIQSADINNKAVISGGGWNVRLMGNYIRLRGLSLRNPTGDPGSNVQVGSDSGNVATGNIIEDSTMVDPPTANWASSGVLLRNSKNTLIQRNSMQTTAVAARGQSYGVFFWGTGAYGGNVIRDNNITSEGTFRDSIGGSGNFQVGAGPGQDSFMYDNYLYGSYDDGIESEGGNMNVAIFDNIIKNNNQATDAARMINGIGLASVVIGPVYAMRNVIISPREGTFKVGSSSYGTVHLYHNIAYQAGYGLIFTSGNNRIAENYIVRNNITQGTGRVMGHYTDTIPLAQQTDTFDYDIVYASGDWFGFWYGIRYETLAALKSGSTHEQHSIDANPAFVNPGGGDFTLQAASPAIDAGVLIPGVNNADSPWPYQGAAPDIGVFEYGSGPPTNQPPVLAAIGSKSVIEGQLLSFTISATDPNGDTLTYSASNLPSGASFNAGTRTFSWTPTTGQAGTYSNVNFQVSDGSLTDSEAITITVSAPTTNQPPVLAAIGNKSVTAGQLLSFTISATDPNGDTLTYSASNLPSGATFNAGTRTFSWTPTTGQVGTYANVTFQVSDGSLTDSEAITITVSAPSTGQSTTVGSLSLVSTIVSIGVSASFSGDTNGNNQATLEYRQSGSAIWKPGITMTVDRRDVLTGAGSIANPYKNQWRASVFWLNPDTTYEVRVTYSDADGVVGTNPVTASVRTRKDVIPIGTGTKYYVSTTGSDTNPGTEAAPFRTIQKAANTVQSGATVYIKAGTYNESVTIFASGANADSYIIFTNYGTDEVWVDSNGLSSNNFALSGNYIMLHGIKMRNAWNSGVYITGANNRVENSRIEEWARRGDTGYADDWLYAGIMLYPGTNSVIRGNTLYKSTGYYTFANSSATGNAGPGMIMVRNTGTGAGGGHVIAGNRLETSNGQVKDGIGSAPEDVVYGGVYKDTDIYDNTIINAFDDSIQVEGGDINVRIWGNTLQNNANSGLAISPAVVGPMYFLRNVMINNANSGGVGAFKTGSGGSGRVYAWHNTIYNSQSGGKGPSFGGGTGFDGIEFKNNIVFVTSYVYNFYNTAYDRNNMWMDYNSLQAGSTFARWWNTSYGSLSAFSSGTGQDTHSVIGNPLFVNAAAGNFNLQSTSPSIDKGTVLVQINDADSPWPYQGAAPDAGAFEFGSGPPTNQPPVLAAIGNKSVTEGQLLSFTISATDPNGDPLTYSASGLPSGASFSASTRTFSWTPATGQAGSYPSVYFQVSDGSLTDSESITITVTAAPTNQPPVLAAIGNKSATAGQLLTFTISATDPNGDTLTYSVSNLPSGASFSGTTRTFSWTPTTGQAGTYPNIYFQVSDGSLTDSDSITITVTAVPTNQPTTSGDFTAYTEIDPANHITVAPTRVDFRLDGNEAGTYLYLDKGTDYFTNFNHSFEVAMTGGSGWSVEQYAWQVSTSTSLSRGDSVGLELAILSGKPSIRLVEAYRWTAYRGTAYGIALNTPYYVTINKEGIFITAKIYSDIAKTKLLSTLTLTLHTSRGYRYVFPVRSYKTTSADRWLAGYTKDLNLAFPK